MVEVINPQKELFVFHFGGLSLTKTNDEFALNSIVNRLIALSVRCIFERGFSLRRRT